MRKMAYRSLEISLSLERPETFLRIFGQTVCVILRAF